MSDYIQFVRVLSIVLSVETAQHIYTHTVILDTEVINGMPTVRIMYSIYIILTLSNIFNLPVKGIDIYICFAGKSFLL